MRPILESVALIAPFCGVLVFYLCGFCHSYFVLQVPQVNLVKAITLTYSVGMLRTLDLKDLKGIDLQYQYDKESETYEELEPHPPLEYLVQTWIVAVTFCVTIVLLNVFVVVLQFSYEEAVKKCWGSFIKVRASLVTDYVAISIGFRGVKRGRQVERLFTYTWSDHAGNEHTGKQGLSLPAKLEQLRQTRGIEVVEWNARLSITDSQLNALDWNWLRTRLTSEDSHEHNGFLFPVYVGLKRSKGFLSFLEPFKHPDTMTELHLGSGRSLSYTWEEHKRLDILTRLDELRLELNEEEVHFHSRLVIVDQNKVEMELDNLKTDDLSKSIFPVSAWLRSRALPQKRRHQHLWCACRLDTSAEFSHDEPELLKYREELEAQLAPSKQAFIDQLDTVQNRLETESSVVSSKLKELSHHLSELEAALGGPKKRRKALARLTVNESCGPDE